MARQLEQRSRVRITWRVWVAVEGIDDFPRLRPGNVSACGIYFETDRHIGDPGEVQWLHLAATEQEVPLEVMGRIVRLQPGAHLLHGADEGVALEFMPEDDATRDALVQLVRRVATIRMQQEEGVGFGLSTGLGVTSADPRGPGVQRLTLETTMELAVGQVLRLTLETDEGGGEMQLRGRVSQVLPMTRVEDATVNRISIQVIDAPPARRSGLHAVPTHETTTVDLQFNDLVAAVPDDMEPEDRGSGDLVGSLSRVKLSSLLAFLGRARLSGELRLESEGKQATIFINQGRMIDVESTPASPTPRTALAHLVGWTVGSFHFVSGEVQREDRLQIRSDRLLSV